MVVKIKEIDSVKIPWELQEMIIHTEGSRFQFETHETADIVEAVEDWNMGILAVDVGDMNLGFSGQAARYLKRRVSEIKFKHESLDRGFEEMVEGGRLEDHVDGMSEADKRRHELAIELGAKISKKMRDQGISPEDLAEEVGTDVQTIEQVMSGNTFLSIEKLAEIEAVIGGVVETTTTDEHREPKPWWPSY